MTRFIARHTRRIVGLAIGIIRNRVMAIEQKNQRTFLLPEFFLYLYLNPPTLMTYRTNIRARNGSRSTVLACSCRS